MPRSTHVCGSLTSVAEGRGGLAGSLANRTQALRDALLPDGNVTLVGLLNDRCVRRAARAVCGIWCP